MFLLRCVAVLLVGVMVSVGAAQAQKRNYQALVIGNSSYKVPLDGPANDAVDMARALKDIGFVISNASAVTNLERKAMFDQIEAFAQNVDNDTIAVVYYSGHGIEDANKNYLVPTDAVLDSYGDVATRLVPLDHILDRMAAREARTVIVILDACRNMPTGLKYKSLGEKGGLRALKTLNPGIRVIYAASPDQVAQAAPKGQRNSVFTGAVLRAMKERRNAGFEDIMNRAAVITVESTDRRQIPYSSGTFGLAWVDSPRIEVNPLKHPSNDAITPAKRPAKQTAAAAAAAPCTEVSEQVTVNGTSTWQKRCIPD
ncbi:MAG: caspase family protein [Comamonadaceae bacterium]|nr:MAG: caspase family protein [Comamonadaceae bacterium]